MGGEGERGGRGREGAHTVGLGEMEERGGVVKGAGTCQSLRNDNRRNPRRRH